MIQVLQALDDFDILLPVDKRMRNGFNK